MLNYALLHGFSYTRWQTVVNCLIEKDLGQPKIHRLRVIHLYENDYNLILAMKWRPLTFTNETSHSFNLGQYGARPGLTAYDPVYIENIQNEIARVSRRPYIKFSNAAAACYDRMIPNLANLASRAFGMDPRICRIQDDTLHKAKYKLKTSMRISDAEGNVSFACCLGERGVQSEPVGLGFRTWNFEIFCWSGMCSLIVVQQADLPPKINLGGKVRQYTHP
jgi:hypothetical protein